MTAIDGLCEVCGNKDERGSVACTIAPISIYKNKCLNLQKQLKGESYEDRK